jgi:hypothetical protein
MRLASWSRQSKSAKTAWVCGIGSLALWGFVAWMAPRRTPVFHGIDPLMALVVVTLYLLATVGVLAACAALGQNVFDQPRNRRAIGIAVLAVVLNAGAHPWVAFQGLKWRNERRAEEWRVKRMAEQREGSFRNSGKANAIVFSPDGLKLASAIVNDVQIWNAVSGKLTAELRGHRGVVTSLAFTPDGSKLLTSSDDHTVRVWSWFSPQGALLHTFERQPDWVSSVAVSRDGRTVAFGGERGNVTLGDLQTYQTRRPFFAGVATIHALAFSTSEDVLAVAGEGGVALWNAQTGESLAELPESQGHIKCLAFTRDGQRLIAGGGEVGVGKQGVLVEWNLATREKRLLPTEHTKMLESLALSRDDGYLATSAWDNRVLIYDRTTGEQVSRGKYSELVCSVAFNPVTHSLAIAGIHSIRILHEPFPSNQHFPATDSTTETKPSTVEPLPHERH